MKIIYYDIDSQRPDHLGVYGYHRPTSPNIDVFSKDALVFDNVYVSDSPCLPSRTALFTGRFGIKTGVVGHGGTAADPFIEGPTRGFGSKLGRTSWVRLLRNAGLWTASVSPFAERHAAWHFCANWNEQINTGKRGLETADEIVPNALEWMKRNQHRDDWFLHINVWDPHTPYRAEEKYFDAFKDSPLPSWPNKDTLQEHLKGCGPHSASEATGFGPAGSDYKTLFPKQPDVIDSESALRQLFDGYDAGVRAADDWFGEILKTCRSLGIEDDVAIIISGDHGENLGELNIYADHMTADSVTPHVPMIIKWPGKTDGLSGQHFKALHYQFDIAATTAEWLGQEIPDNWSGRSIASTLAAQTDRGRDALVLSHGAWTCQRSSLWEEQNELWLCMKTTHDGFHGFPKTMLFNVTQDPRLEFEISKNKSTQTQKGLNLISDWEATQLSSSDRGDPLHTVISEGGPKHTKGALPEYLARLRTTGRGHWADHLEAEHG